MEAQCAHKGWRKCKYYEKEGKIMEEYKRKLVEFREDEEEMIDGNV